MCEATGAARGGESARGPVTAGATTTRLAAAIAAAAGLWISLEIRHTPHFDDAFITYVFARHLADGLGVVWVPGDAPVFGTSSPLYMWLLAMARRGGADLVAASTVLNVVGWSVAAGSLFVILARRMAVLAALSGSVLAIVVSLGPRLSAGMETGVYVALVFGACAVYDSGRARLALLMAAAAALARPDGVLIVAVLLAHHVLRGCARSIGDRIADVGRAAWPAVLVLVVASAIAFVYFGRVWPQTLAAKSAFGCDVSGCFSAVGLYQPLSDTLGGAGALAFLALALVGVVRGLAAGMPLCLWIAADYLAFAYGGAPDSPWYYATLMLPLAGAVALAIGLPLRRGAPVRMAQSCATMAVAAWVGVLVWPTWIARVNEPAAGPVDPERMALAQTVLDDMRARHATSAHLLAYEVGYFGYAIPGRVDDLLGLVTPSFQPCLRGEDGDAVLARVHPDYVLIVDDDRYRATGCIHRASSLAAGYDVLASRPTPYGMHYLVYRQKPVPAGPKVP